MKLNVGKALAAEAERKAKPVPIPVIRKKTATATTSNAGLTERTVIINAEDLQMLDKSNDLLDNILIGQLEAERHSLMVDRKKLSTRTANLVDEIYQSVKEKEGAATAEEFMKGNIPAAELKEHWSRIQYYTDKLVLIYDRIEYVRQNGKLPDPVPGPELLPSQNVDVAAITWEIRRLDDLIHKLSKKLEQANSGIKKPKNSDRTNTWRTTMAMAEAKRDDLKFKRKQLRNA